MHRHMFIYICIQMLTVSNRDVPDVNFAGFWMLPDVAGQILYSDFGFGFHIPDFLMFLISCSFLS